MMSDKTSKNNVRDPDKKGVFFSIRSKMLMYFGSMYIISLILFIVLDVFGVPFTTFRGGYRQQQSEVFQNLNMVADLKKERLLHWMKECKGDAKVLSESGIVQSQVAALLRVMKENTITGVREDELQAELQKEKSYQLLMQHLNLVKKVYGVYDKIQIVDALKGTIIASTQNQDSGMDISRHDSFARVLRPGYNEIMDIDKDPSIGVLKLFIFHTINLFNDDKASTVLILHINCDDFIKPMLHTGRGLGQTGEALLVNQDMKILTTLKYPLANGTAARPLEYQIGSDPAIFAVEGQEGITATRDYRGRRVLAAYRHIRISSELGWGLVVKRDQAEIFTPLREGIYYRFTLGSICALVMLGLTILIARNLSRPIRLLSKAARKVKDGRFDVRTSITSSDEVGILTSTFNSMVCEIEDWHKKLNKLVEIRTSELETRNAELERYAYTVSHDLKSPLITIKGFLGLLEKDIMHGDTERVKKDVERIHNAAEKMNQLLDELLELSRIGQIVGRKEDVSLKDLANEAVNIVDGQIKKAGVSVEISPNLPIVCVDRRRFVEALQNLVENAVKYMGRQSEPHIEVGVGQNDGKNVYYVRDNGMGIEPRYHENVFGLFNKLDQEHEGTGIGLAIVRRIIEVHGGRIWVESEGKGKGSTFCFTIPEKGEVSDHGEQ